MPIQLNLNSVNQAAAHDVNQSTTSAKTPIMNQVLDILYKLPGQTPQEAAPDLGILKELLGKLGDTNAENDATLLVNAIMADDDPKLGPIAYNKDLDTIRNILNTAFAGAGDPNAAQDAATTVADSSYVALTPAQTIV